MDLGLRDKVAVITGAVGGMGEESARILVDEGAKVVLADIRDEQGAALATELDGAIYVHTDVTQAEDIAHMVDRALEAFGAIDILINTAGIGGRGMTSPEQWDREWAVHVRGTAFCIKEVTERVMIPKGYGKIVNVASLCNHSGSGGMSPYCAAKAAISQITLGGARSLGRHGINMNCVSPGNVRSPMTEAMFSDPDTVARIRKEVVFGQIGDARDVAWVIVFLCSDKARWVIGADINVSAGQVIYERWEDEAPTEETDGWEYPRISGQGSRPCRGMGAVAGPAIQRGMRHQDRVRQAGRSPQQGLYHDHRGGGSVGRAHDPSGLAGRL